MVESCDVSGAVNWLLEMALADRQFTELPTPRTMYLTTHNAPCVIHLPRMRCAGPEAVPQRADNCVTASDDEKHRDGPTQMH